MIGTGETSTISVNLNYNSNGENLLTVYGKSVPDASVVFNAGSLGSFSTLSGVISSGLNVTTIFTAGSTPAISVVNATVDNQTVSAVRIMDRDNLYVATAAEGGGDSTGNGSPEHPFLTLYTAIAELRAGGRVHVAKGVYNGALNRGLAINKDMTIFLDTWKGAGTAIINAEHSDRIFSVTSGVTVLLQSLTLTNGNANGGAIYNQGTLTVTDCTFTGNTASYNGGAIYNSEGTLNVTGCTFTGNTASYNGGAIYNSEGTLNVTGCTFTGNTASYNGGAIYNSEGTLNVIDCTFISNGVTMEYSPYNFGGGAIHNYAGIMDITGSNFTNNYAANNGGAIFNFGCIIPSVITNCTFTGNSEGPATQPGMNFINYIDMYNLGLSSGDICNVYFPLNVMGCIFNGHTAGYSGNGGILNAQGNCVFHFNRLLGNIEIGCLYSGSIDADLNWWGTNIGRPGMTTTWVILTVNATPNNINNTGNSTITADFNHINGGGDLVGGHIPDGPITLDIPWGSFINPGTTHSITEDTVNGAINPVIFYANEGAVNPLYNPVKVTATADGYTTNETESAYIAINGLANISITKTSPATVIAGHQLTYTITITNSGIDSAEGVILDDNVPLQSGTLQYRFKVNDGAWGSWTSFINSLHLDLGTIESGKTAVIEIMGTVDPSTPKGTVIINTATANTTTTPSPKVATVTTIVDTQANLVVSKTGPVTVNAGNRITYTITVTNNGPSDAQNVQIQDVIPAILQNVTHDSFNLGTIGAGQTITVTITGTVPSGTALGTVIENSATVTSDTSGTITPSETVITTVNTQADLVVSKIGPTTVAAGNQVTYTITVTNNGSSDAQNVVIHDVIPVILQNVTHDSFNLGTIGAGQSKTVTITGTVPSSIILGTIIENSAIVTSDTSGTITPSGTVQTTVNTQSALNVVKESILSHVTPGVTYTDPIYRITVTNNGPSDARDVQVTDILPGQIADREYRMNGGAWISFTGNLDQLIAYIASGASDVIEIRGRIPSSTPEGSMSNMASASVYGTSFNSNSVNTAIIKSTDVGLTKIVDKVRPNVGETVTFTVTAHNYGSSDATNIRIEDIMSSDFADVIITSSTGTYAGGVWTLDLASGEEAILILSGKVTAIMAGKNTTNTATILNQTEQDPNSTDSASASIYVPKSDMYIKITSDKKNPKVGETFTLTYKLGNKGPDEATNVTITIPLPEDFEIVKISGDGKWTYNSATRTITWTLANVPVGDPYLYITGKVTKAGTYVFSSSISSETYSINSEGITPVTINAVSQVNAASKTIPMRHTGLPIAGLVLAVLAVFGGLLMPIRK